jgi:orotidine-5'-phosphate decarboxylase
MGQFAERLAELVRRYGPLCVGLDPQWERLPLAWRTLEKDKPLLEQVSERVFQFGLRILELVRPYSRIVKFQAAFFELLGPEGMRTLQRLIQAARQQGWLTILDAKRGDIPSTATAYALAALGRCAIDQKMLPIWDADAVTVNPYLGEDAITPFVHVAQTSGRGLFVLVRTSNAGAGLFQDLPCGGRPLYEHVAEAVARWNVPTVSRCGFGDIGAVVGATRPQELAALRQKLTAVWFLVPGYGAQGGTAADIRQAAVQADGLGAIVNSSRGVVFAFQPEDPQWEQAIQLAAQKACHELKSST